MIITIDGPAGTGKSTVAKGLAEELGFTYFDTGAMYRTITYGIILHNVDYKNPEALQQFLASFPIKIKTHYLDKRYFLGDLDVTDKIRDPGVNNLVSQVSSYQAVRDILVAIQRDLASGVNVVVEGRDMGTVVFPKADLKIFLTATLPVRAKRRYDEIVQKEPGLASTLTLKQVEDAINQRDTFDASRDISPMKPADDAVIIDTGPLTADEVIAKIIILKENKEAIPKI